MNNQAQANTYDLVRFPTLPRPTTLPSALAAQAYLRGREVAPFSESRILEIACGDGGNLLSLAAMAPGAECVGFDLAVAPITDGIALAKAAGLGNVVLTAGDILDPGVIEGQFDYVIAHGVYAWVPAAVRDALMALAARVLSPKGLALISYNVAPGSDLKRTLRTVMLDAIAGVSDPGQRLAAAREALSFYAALWGSIGPTGSALKAEAMEALDRAPEVLFHDELGEVFEPQLLTDVVAHASRHGLGYLCDSLPAISRELIAPSPDLAPLRERAGGSPVRYEQLEDFAVNRQFRESIFTHGRMPSAAVDAGRVSSLFAQAAMVEVESTAPGVRTYRSPRGLTVDIDNAEVATLFEDMADVYPNAVALDGADARVTAAMVQLFTLGELGLFTEPFGFRTDPGSRPLASPLARAQARRGDRVLATLRHHPLEMADPAARQLIGLMDGTRDAAQLAAEMAAFAGGTVAESQQRLPSALRQLGRLALFRWLGTAE